MTLTPRAGGIVTAGFMQALTNVKVDLQSPGAVTTVSSTFAVLNSTTYTKISDESTVHVEMHAYCYTATATATVEFGLRFGSSTYDYVIIRAPLGSIAVHRHFAGHVILSGVPSGVYTVSTIWRRPLGAGTVTLNSGDGVSYTMCEVQEW
jgi:hypothetical protein